ncbi:MAG: type VI secretion system ImpA family N-terminal domain-containing protein [Burkholderiaceae bacterium]|nr:type VI secretion system ImpA family N-terminal domain-containing protein [Burkholderiaceae bacterium]
MPPAIDRRSSHRFLAMRKHVASLCNAPRDAAQWHTVADLGVQILALEGKDFSVATWLTAALWETSGPEGLAQGVLILSDLIEHEWHDIAPCPHTIERRTQMQWLLDHLDERLHPEEEMYPALPARMHRALLDDWVTLTCVWERHDIELPKFYRLHARLCSLPVTPPER